MRAASHETGLGPALSSNPTASHPPRTDGGARISAAMGRWRRGAGPTGSLAPRPHRLRKACVSQQPRGRPGTEYHGHRPPAGLARVWPGPAGSGWPRTGSP